MSNNPLKRITPAPDEIENYEKQVVIRCRVVCPCCGHPVASWAAGGWFRVVARKRGDAHPHISGEEGIVHYITEDGQPIVRKFAQVMAGDPNDLPWR
jgi:hypothetical protein